MIEKYKAYIKLSSFRVFTVRVFITTALLLITFGCSKRYQDLPTFIGIPFEDSENYSVGRFKTSYMADQIHAYFRGNIAGPIAVTTFVEIDNLYQSSTFGRILAEQLISELSMRGYNVIEIRLSDAVQIMEEQGELGLSRQVDTLRGQQSLSGLVVGTYAASPERVYVNSRIIDPKSSNVVSVASVEMKKTSEISQLLRGNSVPTSLERIPVRHLSSDSGSAGSKQTAIHYGSSSFGLDTFGTEFGKKLAFDAPLVSMHENEKLKAQKAKEMEMAKEEFTASQAKEAKGGSAKK